MKSLGFMLVTSLALTSVAAGLLAPFVINLLLNTAAQNSGRRDHDALADFALAHPYWLPALAAPGAICGLVTLARRRFSPVLFMLGVVSLLMLIGALLAAFLAVVAPMYRYQQI